MERILLDVGEASWIVGFVANPTARAVLELNVAGDAMTVRELMEVLGGFPGNAVVLYQGDGGVSLIADVSLEANVNGMPDEVILHPSMEGD